MKITLTSKTLGSKELFIDEEDYIKITQLHWCLAKESKNSINELIYAVGFYPPRKKGVSLIRMHRFILEAPKGQRVDHINGNTLDNRKQNLRLTDHAVNMQNTRKRANASSKYKGVDFTTKNGLWRARIYIAGVQHNLGAFKTETDAAKAYNEAVDKFGSVSPKNII